MIAFTSRFSLNFSLVNRHQGLSALSPLFATVALTGGVAGPKPVTPPPPATASPMTWAPLHNENQYTVDHPRKHSLSYLGIPNKHNLLVRTCGCLVVQQHHGSSCTLSGTIRIVGQGSWIVDSHRRHGLSTLLLDLSYESTDDAWTRCLCGSSGSDNVHSCTRRRWCRNSTNRDC